MSEQKEAEPDRETLVDVLASFDREGLGISECETAADMWSNILSFIMYVHVNCEKVLNPTSILPSSDDMCH